MSDSAKTDLDDVSGAELAVAAARAARDMKAEDVQVLDLRGLSAVADFYVLASANSTPHLRGLLREVSALVLQEFDRKPTYREGATDSEWMVLDYIDVMVHVFLEEKREFYAMERLWKDAIWLEGERDSALGGDSAREGGSALEGGDE